MWRWVIDVTSLKDIMNHVKLIPDWSQNSASYLIGLMEPHCSLTTGVLGPCKNYPSHITTPHGLISLFGVHISLWSPMCDSSFIHKGPKSFLLCLNLSLQDFTLLFYSSPFHPLFLPTNSLSHSHPYTCVCVGGDQAYSSSSSYYSSSLIWRFFPLFINSRLFRVISSLLTQSISWKHTEGPVQTFSSLHPASSLTHTFSYILLRKKAFHFSF